MYYCDVHARDVTCTCTVSSMYMKNVIKHTCAIHRKDKGTYMGLSYTKAIYGTKNTSQNIKGLSTTTDIYMMSNMEENYQNGIKMILIKIAVRKSSIAI